MKFFLERYMFLVVLLYVVSTIVASPHISGSWDMNRTVGWGWDMTNILWWGLISGEMFFLIGYGIILLIGHRNLFYFSLAHVTILVLSLMSNIITGGYFLSQLLYFLSWIAFMLNLILSEKIIKTVELD